MRQIWLASVGLLLKDLVGHNPGNFTRKLRLLSHLKFASEEDLVQCQLLLIVLAGGVGARYVHLVDSI